MSLSVGVIWDAETDLEFFTMCPLIEPRTQRDLGWQVPAVGRDIGSPGHGKIGAHSLTGIELVLVEVLQNHFGGYRMEISIRGGRTIKPTHHYPRTARRFGVFARDPNCNRYSTHISGGRA